MDWLDLLAVQGTCKSLLQHHSSKASILQRLAFFTVQLSHPYMTTGKTIALTRWTFVAKGQFSFESQRKAMPKNAQTTAQLHSSHTLIKSCSKLSKPGFGNTWIVKLLMVKLVLGKTEEPENKLPTSVGSSKKQESSRKTSISASLTMPKHLIVWISINCGRKRWEYQSTWPASWEICVQVRKQQLELDLEQQTGSK